LRKIDATTSDISQAIPNTGGPLQHRRSAIISGTVCWRTCTRRPDDNLCHRNGQAADFPCS